MKKFFYIWFILLVIKLVASAILPMSSDESYYWMWSEMPQLSYYDHPAMISWLFWLGHPFESFFQAVRWPIVIVGHLSIWFWILILHRFLEEKKIFWWLAIASLSPLVGFGLIICTPDVPLMFFWSMSLYFLIKSIETQKALWYGLLGASLGLGFCSKYHIVIFVLSLFVWLIFERRWNHIRWKYVLFTVFLGLIFSLPVLVWNYQNEFISFTFQLKHGLKGGGWKAEWTYSYLASVVAVVFPPLFYYIFKTRLKDNARVLFYFAWVPIFFFLLTSFKASVEANWPIMAYPALLALAVYSMKRSAWIWVTSGFWAIFFTLVIAQVYRPWLPIPPETLKTNEPNRYAKVYEAMEKHKPFYASTYQMASYLWYKTKKPVYKLRDMSRVDQYDFMPGSLPKEKKFYVAVEGDSDLPDWLVDGDYTVRHYKPIDSIHHLILVKKK